MIAPAMPSVACTVTADNVAGITCRSRTRAERRAQRARRLHVLELAHLQHLTAHQPRVAHPSDRDQRQHDVRQARAEHGDQRNRQQDAGKRQQHVHHAAEQRRRSSRRGSPRSRRSRCRRATRSPRPRARRGARSARPRAAAPARRGRARPGRADARSDGPASRSGRSCATGSCGHQPRAERRPRTTAKITTPKPRRRVIGNESSDRATRRPGRRAGSSRRTSRR